MAPMGDRILIKPMPEEKKTKGGIIIATTSGGAPNMAECR